MHITEKQMASHLKSRILDIFFPDHAPDASKKVTDHIANCTFCTERVSKVWEDMLERARKEIDSKK